ncbi:hypothetical protein EDB84DRAFT_1676085 [Lactarius hengduanensis]|nr:hypothetical protein EDB84DRAFT_1676085 [Lactarius hengduanensis]
MSTSRLCKREQRNLSRLFGEHVNTPTEILSRFIEWEGNNTLAVRERKWQGNNLSFCSHDHSFSDLTPDTRLPTAPQRPATLALDTFPPDTDCVNHATAPPPPARFALDTFRWRVTNDATPAKRATRRECPQPAQRRSASGIRLAAAAWEGMQRAILARFEKTCWGLTEETAERIGVKRGNKARGKVDSARTAEHIGEINRENEDPYGAGGQSGKRAKPDARSAAANVNARERATIQPSRPPVPSPHTPAPVLHYIPSPLPLSQPATRPASPLPLPASLPPRLSTSRAHGPLPPQVPYYPPPFLSQPAPFVPQFTQYPFQMPHYAFYHPSQ